MKKYEIFWYSNIQIIYPFITHKIFSKVRTKYDDGEEEERRRKKM